MSENETQASDPQATETSAPVDATPPPAQPTSSEVTPATETPAAAASEANEGAPTSGAPGEPSESGSSESGSAEAAPDSDAVGESNAGDQSSSGAEAAPGEGGKKKRRRRRKKKKRDGEAEGARPESSDRGGEQRRPQAFTHLFSRASRQQVFKAGEVVAGMVRSTENGAIVVDLFGKALAIVDAHEPHEIEPLPEPPPPASPEAEMVAEGAPVHAPVDASAPTDVAKEGVAKEGVAKGAVVAPASDGVSLEAHEMVSEGAPPPAVSAEIEAASGEVTAAAVVEAAPGTTPEDESTVDDEESDESDDDGDIGDEEDPSAEDDDADSASEVVPASLEPEGPPPPLPSVGSVYRGRVASVSESGHVALVNRVLDRAAVKAAIRQARDERRRVNGIVFGFNRGGFDVLVGGVRCFAPVRGMSLAPLADPSELVGQKLEFTIPPSRGGKSIIVSRRGILERDQRKQARERMKSLKPGQRFEGPVTQIRDFGLLVDLGDGVDGLVHQSEVSWNRADRPSDVAKPGDIVKVEVLRVSMGTRKDRYGKVSLSMKKCLPDPWDEATKSLQIGVPIKGTVMRTAEFGAFVQVAPGVEGLLHISELGRDVKHAKDVLKDGEEIDVIIERKDDKQHRLSLSRLTKEDLAAIERGELDLTKAPKSLKPGTIVKVNVQRVEHHGIFVQVQGVVGKRGRGYIPNRELPDAGPQSGKKKNSQGAEMEVKIVGVDRSGALKCSVAGKLHDEERKAVQDYRKEAAQQGGFGTFADLLKQKLGDASKD